MGGNSEFGDVRNLDEPYSLSSARGEIAESLAAHVRDGERLELGGRALEIVRTPGHTPDSICLRERASGLLFTGDTYYSGEIYL